MSYIIHIELAKVTNVISGGEISMINIIDIFSRNNYNQYLITTRIGKDAYNRYFEKRNIKCQILSIPVIPFFGETAYILLNYLALGFFAFLFVGRRLLRMSDCLISHSDFFPNIVFSLIARRIFKKKWLCFNHMEPPAPNFTKILEEGAFYQLKLVHHFLTQKFFWKCSKYASGIFVVDPKLFKKYILERPKLRLISLAPDMIEISEDFLTKEKDYDICFIGRSSPQKGISDLKQIVEYLKSILGRKVNVILIGHSRIPIELANFNAIFECCNLRLIPHAEGQEKYELIASAKVMVIPSRFETFSIVFFEGMRAGTPVVEYSLRETSHHVAGCLRVTPYNIEEFSAAINLLLSDNIIYNKLRAEGLALARKYDWNMIFLAMKEFL
jgi:glycosyltransferase involved in cell wall biosynthesis